MIELSIAFGRTTHELAAMFTPLELKTYLVTLGLQQGMTFIQKDIEAIERKSRHQKLLANAPWRNKSTTK